MPSIRQHNKVLVTYNGQQIKLDEGVDIGYCVEKTTLTIHNHGEVVIPIKGVTIVIISLPFINESILTELLELGNEFEKRAVADFEAILVLPNMESCPDIPFFKLAYDKHGEFGEEFGVAIDCAILNKTLSKALFVVSRDNVLFYKDVCKNLEDNFNLDRFYMQVGKSMQIYTGTGCH